MRRSNGNGAVPSAWALFGVLALAPPAPAQSKDLSYEEWYAQSGKASFTLTYDASIAGTFTGRVYVMLRTTPDREPRFGPAWRDPGVFFALDVTDWKPGKPLVFTDKAAGFPATVDELPRGNYFVQAVMRRDLDSPSIGTGDGNAYSEVVQRELAGETGGNVDLRIDRTVEVTPFQETGTIKLLEIRSDLLSAFHGRDIMLRAAIILPPDYDRDPAARYPALYMISGFGTDHRLAHLMQRRFVQLRGADRLIFIVPDPLCGTGHHAFADSDNNGPYGRAFVEELIPALQARFRLVAEPAGRYLAGGSSGGWSSLWLQVSYPDFFGGVWSFAPDPIDFHAFQRINLYEPDANFFRGADGERLPIMRSGDKVLIWVDDFAHMEAVQGAGGQLSSFEAVFGPRGTDGRPMPLYDRVTGDVDPDVVEAWKRYDIRLHLERNWPDLKPRLAGKLNIFVGARDDFYLDEAVRLAAAWLASAGSDAVIEILPGRDHSTAFDQRMQQRMIAEVLTAYRQRK